MDDNEIYSEAVQMAMDILHKENPKEWLSIMGGVEMKKVCAAHRGQYLEGIAAMEGQIDDIIVEHFCGGDAVKKDELMHVILTSDKITLTSKWLIVKYIYEAYYPDIREWFNYADGKNKTMFAEVEKLIKDRNQIAHRKYNVAESDVLLFDGDIINLDKKHDVNGQIKDKKMQLSSEFLKESNEKMGVIFFKLNELKNAIIKKREG